jgi:hypothetical protein
MHKRIGIIRFWSTNPATANLLVALHVDLIMSLMDLVYDMATLSCSWRTALQRMMVLRHDLSLFMKENYCNVVSARNHGLRLLICGVFLACI